MPLIAGGAVAGVAVLALIGYVALSGGGGGAGHNSSANAGAASPTPTHTSFQPTSSDPATAAEQTGAAFLTAWQSGNLEQAAKYTDNPTAALAALTSYKSSLNISALTVTPQPAVVAGASPTTSGASGSPSTASSSAAGSNTGAATGSVLPSGTVPFTVAASVSVNTASLAPATSGTASPSPAAQAGQAGQTMTLPWNYTSNLTAYKQSDGWSVKWSASILAPKLADGEKLAVVAVPPGAGKIVDASGDNLSGASDAALRNIAAAMTKKAPTGQGTAGVAIEITDASGTAVSGTTMTLQQPVNATLLKTTISPSLEALAESAVGMNPRSSMVVLRASTGAILAVANSAGNPDTALTGTLAPGSTFKIVTSAALLNHGDVSVSTPVACPPTFTVDGITFHNATNGPGTPEESEPAGTPFLKDFADSCNNAFTPFYSQLEGGKLASTASSYFGLGLKWDIGLGANAYFGMPGDSVGSELAQENFGQGQVEANPLAMASVVATVGTGQFNQPYLVSSVTKATATPLPSGTDAALKQMMRAVVTEGTAAGVFDSVGRTLYAKTGTAEADANKDKKNNGWIVVYDPSRDIAIGCVVIDSGFGAQFAGPEASYVLAHM
ncbi:MAG TPA: penicillin-binding transpeptidase domain-containing protein [Actinocrinis sp.]|uniref:penicillin-binding transpeptidase domain-containing protein n=1 Tax=Actinocrinis sp. TaxID=1920516 RepID=UPI002DDCE8EC|nr:penicillin-binding transpeptidase domain-containing protein [Actinocrinis sp.]HEV3170156.1 penicillin-binding transpeptidase domain-containing protein [Actinocrinis sp.]